MNQAIHTIDLLRWIGGPVASVARPRRDARPRDGGRGHGHRSACGSRTGRWARSWPRPAPTPSSRPSSGSTASRGHVRIVGEERGRVGRPGDRRPATGDERTEPRRDRDDARPGAPARSATSASTRTSSRPCDPGGRRPSPGEDGRNAVEIVTAAYEADRTGRAVLLGERRTMKVGAARVDITPPLGMQLEGYEVRADGAIGIHDPLHARALVAEGADGTTVALVVADLIQIDPRLQGLIAERGRGADRHPPRAPPARRHAHPQRSAPARAVRRGADDRPRDRRAPSRGPGRTAARRSPPSAIGARRGDRREPPPERRARRRPGDRDPLRRPRRAGRSRPTSTTAATRPRWARTTCSTARTTRASCAGSWTRRSAA